MGKDDPLPVATALGFSVTSEKIHDRGTVIPLIKNKFSHQSFTFGLRRIAANNT
jgi:hypothetical protein